MNQQGIVTSFKQDILNGVHVFGTVTPNTFKAALFLSTANIGAATTAYSTTNELTNASGTTGYTAGGVTVSNTIPPTTSGTTAYWTPSGNYSWTALTSSAPFDSVLLYNATASGKNAVSVHTFGAQSITAGNFTLTMPPNAAGTALINLN
jgi:hypothetical protein